MKWKQPLLGVLGAVVISLSAPRDARASSGKSFLETIGISAAVGTVLGASTLPFYDQPGTHLMNLVYGASIGAVTGVGIGVYRWISGGSKEHQEIFGHQPITGRSHLVTTARPISVNASRTLFAAPPVPSRQTNLTFWTPLVSLTW